MKALILAAGYATRLYPLTLNCPKALLKIGNRTMLDFLMEKIREISAVDEVIIVTNSKFYSQFTHWAGSADYPVKITVLDDGTSCEGDRLGAVGDMIFAIQKGNISDDLMVLACDNLFTFSLNDFYIFYEKTQSDCVCVGEIEDIEELKRFCVLEVDGEGVILNCVEKPQSPKTNLAAYALYIYKKETVQMLCKYYTESNEMDSPGCLLERIVRDSKVFCYRFSGESIDIGTIKSYYEACEMFS